MAEPHEVLGVAPDADDAAVRAAYRDLLKEHHPDHGGSTERFVQIRNACERIVGGGSITEPLSDGGGTVMATRRTAEATSETVEGDSGLELVARADGLVVTLSVLTDRLPAGAMLPDHVESGRRVAACFLVTNETGQPVTWKARKVRFVGSQGERYLPSVYRPKHRRLPAEWRGDDVDLDPGDTAQCFLLSRVLPENVAVEAVVYDQSSSAGPACRVEFELDERVRTALNREPFQ